MSFWTKYKGWIALAAVIIAIICARTLECGPIIWLGLGLLVAWVIAAMRAEDERAYRRKRWEKGYRDDD